MQYALNIILVQDFCPPKIKITQCPGRFRLNSPTNFPLVNFRLTLQWIKTLLDCAKFPDNVCILPPFCVLC